MISLITLSKRLKSGENLQETRFIWDGSHLVQEIDHKTDRTFSYIYSHPNSYEPLAQLEFAKDNENPTGCYYYHNDQIGIPRELTDEQGKLCWTGNYTGWGKIKEEYDLTEDKSIHQPFRLQNQYYDSEIGLHYNFFRYYEPTIGRFTQLDPIGLAGGMNLYQFALNAQTATDPLGLFALAPAAPWIWEGLVYVGTALTGILVAAGIIDAKEEHDKSQSTTQTKSESTSKCEKGSCPPCKPYPVGAIGYQGPESHATGMYAGQRHYHIFVVNQNPNNCQCFWNIGNKKIWGHQYFGVIDPTWINLNGSRRPPNYPH